MYIDNKKVGEAAVDYLSTAFARVTNALAHFEKNDTGVCIDGKIEVYAGTAMTKESLYGEIPVQIKGTRTKPSGNNSVKYQVAIADLEKYLEVYDGVLYFVVFMDKTLQLRQIYYKRFLPYDIREALRRKKTDDQKRLAVRFTPLPDDFLQLNRLCKEFIADKRKQKGLDNDRFLMPGELEDAKIEFEKVELSKTFYSDELPISLKPFETGAYLYGTTPEGKRYVLEKISSIEAISSTSNHTLKAGNFECEAEVNIGEDHRGSFLTVGGISLRFDGTGAIKYTDQGGFRNRLRDSKLFQGLALSGELFFDGSLLGRCGSFDNLDLDELERRIETYKRYVSLMDLLDVVPDWDPSKLSKKEAGEIRRLAEGLVDESHLPIGDHNESLIAFNSDIANSQIKTIGRLDKNGLYEIHNLISPDLAFVPCRGESGELDAENPMPTLFSLTSVDLRLLANINPAKLEQALKKYPITSNNADTSNNALLEMLAAYDKGAICQKEILVCCDIVSKAILDLDLNSEISAINRAQTLHRMNKLDGKWRARLRELAVTTDSKAVRTSAFILLGQTELAKSCLNSFDEIERKRFTTWPIYNLLDQ